jgi:hypothetical protein
MADQGVDHRDAEDHQRIDPVAHDRGARRRPAGQKSVRR